MNTARFEKSFPIFLKSIYPNMCFYTNQLRPLFANSVLELNLVCRIEGCNRIYFCTDDSICLKVNMQISVKILDFFNE